MTKTRFLRASIHAITFTFLLSSFLITMPVEQVEAASCDGASPVGDCPTGEITSSITGRYKTISVGRGMEDGGHQTTDSIDITIPDCSSGSATIIEAHLYWVNRDQDNTGTPPVTADYDNTVTIANDSPSSLVVTADREYVSDGASAGGASRYFYTTMAEDLPTNFIIADGTSHTYTISNFDFSDADAGTALNFGFGFNIVYECPEFDTVTIFREEGMDIANYTWVDSWAVNYTELQCISFSSEASSRRLDLQLHLSGADGTGRQADLWYTTGTGAIPDTVTTDIVGTASLLEADVMGAQQEEEWDIYDSIGGFSSTPSVTTKTAITVPAGATYACIQIDASDNSGTCPTTCHASMALVGSTFMLESVSADVSLTKSVDGNNDSTFSNSEIISEDTNFEWQITVTNDGPDTASGIVVTDTLPAGISYVSDDGGASESSGVITWNVGSLANGASATLTITTILNSSDISTFDGGSGVNIAEVTALNETDIDSTPNNAVSSEDDYDTASVSRQTLSIGNLVWEDHNNNGIFESMSENGINNVRVELYYDSNSNGSYEDGIDLAVTSSGVNGGSGYSITDSNGNWQFNGLLADDYIAVIPCSQFNNSASLDGYVSSTGSPLATGNYEPAPDPDDNINDDDNGYLIDCDIATQAVSLSYGAEPTNDDDTNDNSNLSVDFGVFIPAALGDYVWIDSNQDGLQSDGEEPVSGVTVDLFVDVDNDGIAEPDGDDGSSIGTLVTDVNGFYQFTRLSPGSYFVRFSNLPESYRLTSANNGDESLDSDADATTGLTSVYAISAGEVLGTVDGGLQQDAESELVNTGSIALITPIIGIGLALFASLNSKQSKQKIYRIHS